MVTGIVNFKNGSQPFYEREHFPYPTPLAAISQTAAGGLFYHPS